MIKYLLCCLLSRHDDVSRANFSASGVPATLECQVSSFVRSAVLLFHFLSDIPLPDESTGCHTVIVVFCCAYQLFGYVIGALSTEGLLHYLGLPTLANVLQEISSLSVTEDGRFIEEYVYNRRRLLLRGMMEIMS